MTIKYDDIDPDLMVVTKVNHVAIIRATVFILVTVVNLKYAMVLGFHLVTMVPVIIGLIFALKSLFAIRDFIYGVIILRMFHIYNSSEDPISEHNKVALTQCYITYDRLIVSRYTRVFTLM